VVFVGAIRMSTDTERFLSFHRFTNGKAGRKLRAGGGTRVTRTPYAPDAQRQRSLNSDPVAPHP